MPSAKLKTPITIDHFYHIYNRGNNRERIFFTKANYEFFQDKYQQYLTGHVDTYAYCLLPNHFHFLIKTNSNIVSSQLQRLFQSYAMSINKQENRSGSLFQKTFRRILIQDNVYLKWLFFYIHHNPEKHYLCDDYKLYTYSSFSSILRNKRGIVSFRQIMELFNDRKEFMEFHNYHYRRKNAEE